MPRYEKCKYHLHWVQISLTIRRRNGPNIDGHNGLVYSYLHWYSSSKVLPCCTWYIPVRVCWYVLPAGIYTGKHQWSKARCARYWCDRSHEHSAIIRLKELSKHTFTTAAARTREAGEQRLRLGVSCRSPSLLSYYRGGQLDVVRKRSERAADGLEPRPTVPLFAIPPPRRRCDEDQKEQKTNKHVNNDNTTRG